eukprot:g7899.t1
MRPQRRYFCVDLALQVGEGRRRLQLSKDDVYLSVREQLAKLFGELEVVRCQLRMLHLTPALQLRGGGPKASSSAANVLCFCVCARDSFERVCFAVSLLRGVVLSSSSSQAAAAGTTSRSRVGDAVMSLADEDEDHGGRQCSAGGADFVPALPRVRFTCGALKKALGEYVKVYGGGGGDASDPLVREWEANMRKEIDQLVAAQT